MHITGISIENFGPFSEKHFDEISPGLTVFYGPNEAGKSAIRAFIRMVLFGFMHRNTRGYSFYSYPPENGGSGKGGLSICTASGDSYTIFRREGPHGGPVSVTGKESGGEELLATLIGRIDPQVYQNIFSVSLTELQNAGSLSEGQIRDRIYSAGLGLGSVSLPDAIGKLESEQRGLWSPRAGKLRTRLKELSEKTKDLGAARSELANYESLGKEIIALDGRIENSTLLLRGLRGKIERQKRLVELRPAWDQQAELMRKLSILPVPDDFPMDGLVRLDGLTQEQTQLEGAISDGDRKRDARSRTAANLQMVESFTRNDVAIQRLLSEVAHYRSAAEDLPGLQGDLREAESRLKAGLEIVGPWWDEAKISVSLDLSSIRRKLESTGKDMGDAKAALRDAEGDARNRTADQSKAEKVLLDATNARDSMPDVPEASASELSRREGRMQRLRAAVADLSGVERELRELDLRLVEAQSKTQVREALVPKWVPLLGIVIGVVVVLWGTFSIEISGIIAGLVLIVGGGAFTRLARRDTKVESGEGDGIASLDILHGHREEMRERAKNVNGEIKELLLEFNFQSVPSEREMVERLGLIGREVRQRDEHDRKADAAAELERRLKEVRGFADTALVAVDNSTGQVEQADKAWRDALHGASLSADLEPLTAAEALGQIEALREQVIATDTLRVRVGQISGAVSEIETRLSAVINEAGFPGYLPGNAAPALEHLEAQYRDHLSSEEQLRSLKAQDADWQSERSRYEHNRHDCTSTQASLLLSAGCSDEESFRVLAKQLEDRRSLEHDLETLQQSHSLLISKQGQSYREELETTLDDDMGASIRESQDEIDREEVDLKGLHGDRRSLRDERLRMEESNPTGEIQLKIGQLQEQASEDAHRWAVLTIARSLLEESKMEFQKHRQAPLLRTAARHFNKFTLGRYVDVQAILGEERVEIVESSGRVKDVGALSRGTAEQLYLALRLALIDEYSGSSEGMPVLLDDTMVNFDSDRLDAVCTSIVDVSVRHQVLVLTCHTSFVDQLCAAASAVDKPEPTVIGL